MKSLRVASIAFTLVIAISFAATTHAGGLGYGFAKIKNCLKDISACTVRDSDSKKKK